MPHLPPVHLQEFARQAFEPDDRIDLAALHLVADLEDPRVEGRCLRLSR